MRQSRCLSDLLIYSQGYGIDNRLESREGASIRDGSSQRGVNTVPHERHAQTRRHPYPRGAFITAQSPQDLSLRADALLQPESPSTPPHGEVSLVRLEEGRWVADRIRRSVSGRTGFACWQLRSHQSNPRRQVVPRFYQRACCCRWVLQSWND